MKKIMLALGNESLEKAIKNKLATEFLFTSIATRKGAVLPLVAQEQPDVLIFREQLIGEMNEDSYDILYALRAKLPLTRIIFLYILDEENILETTKFVQMGIYDIWTDKKIHIEDIVDLIKHPKNFGDWSNVYGEMQSSSIPNLPSKPKESMINEPIAIAGHLKISQDGVEPNISEPRILPPLGKSGGYNMGRVKRNKNVETRIPERLVRPQNEHINTEFDIQDSNTDDINLVNSIQNLPKEENIEIITPKRKLKENSVKPETQISKSKEPPLKRSPSLPNMTESNSPKIEKPIEKVNLPTMDKNIKVEATSANNETPLKQEKKYPQIKPIVISNINKEVKGSDSIKKDSNSDIKKRPIIIPEGFNRQRIMPIKEKAPSSVLSAENQKETNIKEQQDASHVEKAIVSPVVKEPKTPVQKQENVKLKIEKEKQALPQKNESNEVKKEVIKNIEKPITSRSMVESKRSDVIDKPIIKRRNKCKVILFSNMDKQPMSHTALNIAIMLAEQGNQVAYINDSNISASDWLMSEFSDISLYGGFPVKNTKLAAKLNLIDKLATLKTTPDTDVFSLVKEMKTSNEVSYIILNVSMESDIENLMVYGDKNYILVKQNYVQFYKILKDYDYRLKMVDIVIEDYDTNKIEVNYIKEYLGKNVVMKIKDSDTMNCSALKNKTPLILLNKEYEKIFNDILADVV